MDTSNPLPDVDRFVGSAARLLALQGLAREVAILTYSVARLDETAFDNWNGGVTGYTLILNVPGLLYGQVAESRSALEAKIKSVAEEFFRAIPGRYLEAVSIVPAQDIDDGWKDRAKAWLSGKGVTNQGRVRSDNVAARSFDGLLFRSESEINLYRSLKATGVTFAPLPVFLRGGTEYQRIEPDFILIKDGVVLHVEVDGDTVHHETPAEAHARTRMLLHEGVPTERVTAKDCVDPAAADRCAQRLLAVLRKHKDARR